MELPGAAGSPAPPEGNASLREANAAGTPSLPTGFASRPWSREHAGAAFGVEVSHTEAEVVGSPVAPPRLGLPGSAWT
jgi:hypothetical protein